MPVLCQDWTIVILCNSFCNIISPLTITKCSNFTVDRDQETGQCFLSVRVVALAACEFSS